MKVRGTDAAAIADSKIAPGIHPSVRGMVSRFRT